MSHDFHPDTHPCTVRLMRHALDVQFDQLDSTTRTALRTFILDTLGVMVSGSSAAFAKELANGLERTDAATVSEASVAGCGERASAGVAAMRNAFHAHCQEFDCVHEAAVVHPLATVQPAVMAWAEREGGVSGRDFMTALAIGVDISTTIGMASVKRTVWQSVRRCHGTGTGRLCRHNATARRRSEHSGCAGSLGVPSGDYCC